MATNVPAHECHAVVAIGMSAGALGPLRLVLCSLPNPLPAAVLVAHHVGDASVLPTLIELWTGRSARFARAREPLVSDSILVCPPGHHLVVNPDGTAGLSPRGRVGYVRPSIDWLFDSVAASLGARATAVVLSGANADGARGTRRIVRAGGRVIAQRPSASEHPQMPLAACRAGATWVEPTKIADTLVRRIARVNAKPIRVWDEPFAARAS